jgi:hypothetical protein
MDEKSVVTGCTRVLMPQAAHLRHKKNQEILILTCLLFLFFCAAEFIGALKANSLSLLGDAVAMSIDVFTVSARVTIRIRIRVMIFLNFINNLMLSLNVIRILCMLQYQLIIEYLLFSTVHLSYIC